MSRSESSNDQMRLPGPGRTAWQILIRTCAALFFAVVLIVVVFVIGRNYVIANARKGLAADFAKTTVMPKHNQAPEKLDRDLVRVLVLDGGGIRGLITLEILAALEEKTGQRAGELFDVIAGSSTGGIIATLLTLPGKDGRPRYTAQELADFYREFSAAVFDSSSAYKIFTLEGLVGPRFPRVGLRKRLIDKIGPVHMAELIKPIWFPSYSDTDREPFYFRSREIPSALISGSDEYLVADTIIAATTVPGLFMPAEIASTDGEKVGLILDGTIYAPNPIISAVLGAVHLYPGKRLYLVSLGTGGAGSSFGVEESSGWGMAQWLPHVLETMAHAEAVFENDFAMLDILPNGEPLCAQYHRIDRPYNAGWSSWFDVSTKNMDALTAFGKSLAHDNDKLITKIATDLVDIGEASGDIAQDYRQAPRSQ
jgi:Patatin-like phospholipase